ncbi:MAG: hypothetical protein NZZ41_00350 [Candidatus Dojkabacteria bacterium]|nr:hypothetical protein [Candidatus Dojkabacteria bacterium]
MIFRFVEINENIFLFSEKTTLRQNITVNPINYKHDDLFKHENLLKYIISKRENFKIFHVCKKDDFYDIYDTTYTKKLEELIYKFYENTGKGIKFHKINLNYVNFMFFLLKIFYNRNFSIKKDLYTKTNICILYKDKQKINVEKIPFKVFLHNFNKNLLKYEKIKEEILSNKKIFDFSFEEIGHEKDIEDENKLFYLSFIYKKLNEKIFNYKKYIMIRNKDQFDEIEFKNFAKNDIFSKNTNLKKVYIDENKFIIFCKNYNDMKHYDIELLSKFYKLKKISIKEHDNKFYIDFLKTFYIIEKNVSKNPRSKNNLQDLSK